MERPEIKIEEEAENPSSRNMTLISLTVTVLLAVGGYVYSSYADLQFEKHQAHIQRVNAQLRNLYGPLYSFSQVTHRTWEEFRSNHELPSQQSMHTTPESEFRKAWMNYMEDVIKPYHQKMEIALLEYSDLIEEDEMPEVLLDLAAYIAAYNIVFNSWERGDTSVVTVTIKHPEDLDAYAKRMYLKLKNEQIELIGIKHDSTNL